MKIVGNRDMMIEVSQEVIDAGGVVERSTASCNVCGTVEAGARIGHPDLAILFWCWKCLEALSDSGVMVKID